MLNIKAFAKRISILSILLLLSSTIILGQKPVIGISSTAGAGTHTSVSLYYVKSVIRAGGVPVVLPMTSDTTHISILLKRIDGLILTGGEDIDPLKYYGEKPLPQLGEVSEERDSFDYKLLKMAVLKGIPVLGICRGMQMMNVAFGGSLYQDIPSQVKQSLNHNQSNNRDKCAHMIYIDKGSILHKQIGLEKVCVNSLHHQSVKRLAAGFKTTATSKDGIVEAIEMVGNPNVFGVQFHPEAFTANGSDTFLGIFKDLVKKSSVTNAAQ